MKNIIKTHAIYIFLLAAVAVACKEDIEPESNGLVGCWIDAQHLDNGYVQYSRVDRLTEDVVGIQFGDEGYYFERVHPFCGTPPVVYMEHTGNWERTSKTGNVVEIVVEQSYHIDEYQFRIISVDKSTLVVERL